MKKDLISKLEFDKRRYMSCGKSAINNKGNIFGVFRGEPLWLILPNKFYEENIRAEFPNKFYSFPHKVPKYIIFKNHNKVGMALPRISKKGNDFLFIVSNKSGLDRYYYIWDLDKDYKIKSGSTIYFDALSEKGLIINP